MRIPKKLNRKSKASGVTGIIVACGKTFLIDSHFTDKYINQISIFLISVLPATKSAAKAAKLEEICRSSVVEKNNEPSMSSKPASIASASNSNHINNSSQSQSSRRLIKADFSLFKVSSLVLVIT